MIHGMSTTPTGSLAAAVEKVKDAYHQLHWAGDRVGEDATCIACGERWSVGCEPGCFAGDGWRSLIEVCNEAGDQMMYEVPGSVLKELYELRAERDKLREALRGIEAFVVYADVAEKVVTNVLDIIARAPLAATEDTRLPECVANWPECEDGAYDPRCCRFPKSCSCAAATEDTP